jgi:hypothetical protein
MKRLLLIVPAVAILGAFAAFVWPTQWRYDDVRADNVTRKIRVNRITDKTQVLTHSGWSNLEPAPISDLAMTPQVELPAGERERIAIRGSLTDSGLNGNSGLTFIVDNRSAWHVERLVITVDTRSSTKLYHACPADDCGLGLSIGPGTMDSLAVSIGNMAGAQPAWRIEKIMGHPDDHRAMAAGS